MDYPTHFQHLLTTHILAPLDSTLALWIGTTIVYFLTLLSLSLLHYLHKIPSIHDAPSAWTIYISWIRLTILPDYTPAARKASGMYFWGALIAFIPISAATGLCFAEILEVLLVVTAVVQTEPVYFFVVLWLASEGWHWHERRINWEWDLIETVSGGVDERERNAGRKEVVERITEEEEDHDDDEDILFPESK